MTGGAMLVSPLTHGFSGVGGIEGCAPGGFDGADGSHVVGLELWDIPIDLSAREGRAVLGGGAKEEGEGRRPARRRQPSRRAPRPRPGWTACPVTRDRARSAD